jgi:hypothetical protein
MGTLRFRLLYSIMQMLFYESSIMQLVSWGEGEGKQVEDDGTSSDLP